jgi:hypothetical protein
MQVVINMNERILELAEQAGINVIPRRPYIDEEPDGYLESDNDFVSNNYEVAVKLLEGDLLKKFADMIVRECARVYWNIDQSETHTEYVNDLKKHFGVEE